VPDVARRSGDYHHDCSPAELGWAGGPWPSKLNRTVYFWRCRTDEPARQATAR
jgi:hypothetical protein